MNIRANVDPFGHPDLRAIFRDQFEALAALRQAIEATLETMIEALDRLDMQTVDMEPGGDDEPSLSGTYYGQNGGLDLEADTSDEEPSLGSLDGQTDQTNWANGAGHDYEADCHEIAGGAQ